MFSNLARCAMLTTVGLAAAQSDSGCLPSDIDGNGVVNIDDLLIFLSVFGNACN